MILEKKKRVFAMEKLDRRSWCRDILFGVATWLREGLSLVEREVATRKWSSDLAGLQWVSGLSSGN